MEVTNPALYLPDPAFFYRFNFFLTQALDVGVTRMLVQRLVKVFSLVCRGRYPAAGSALLAFRAGNKRLDYLHRRSKACTTAPA